MQGRSMVPWLTDSGKAEEPRTLYWQHEVNAAIREGNWKLVTSDDRKPDRWELYDLTEDRSESDDLSGDYPQRVEQMKDQWQEWAENSDVLPWPEERGRMERVPLPPR